MKKRMNMENKNWFFLIFLFVLFGCSLDKMQTNDDVMNFDSAPFVDVPRENLPGWLNEWIDLVSPTFVGNPLLDLDLGAQATIHRGIWKGSTVYRVWTLYSSCLFCFQDEKGEYISYSNTLTTIDLNYDLRKILPGSKNWELIFQIKDGVLTTVV